MADLVIFNFHKKNPSNSLYSRFIKKLPSNVFITTPLNTFYPKSSSPTYLFIHNYWNKLVGTFNLQSDCYVQHAHSKQLN